MKVIKLNESPSKETTNWLYNQLNNLKSSNGNDLDIPEEEQQKIIQGFKDRNSKNNNQYAMKKEARDIIDRLKRKNALDQRVKDAMNKKDGNKNNNQSCERSDSKINKQDSIGDLKNQFISAKTVDQKAIVATNLWNKVTGTGEDIKYYKEFKIGNKDDRKLVMKRTKTGIGYKIQTLIGNNGIVKLTNAFGWDEFANKNNEFINILKKIGEDNFNDALKQVRYKDQLIQSDKLFLMIYNAYCDDKINKNMDINDIITASLINSSKMEQRKKIDQQTTNELNNIRTQDDAKKVFSNVSDNTKKIIKSVI